MKPARRKKAGSVRFRSHAGRHNPSSAGRAEPGSLRLLGPRGFTLEDRFKPSGARPPALDKFAAAFSTAGERQQKATEEKKGALLEHFSGDPDVEEARAEIEYAQEIKETFHKDFDGIGLG